jgi:hypothetical protein
MNKPALYIGQIGRTQELSDRIYDRNLPTTILKPNYDPRPLNTKRAKFPVNLPPMCEQGEGYYLEYTPSVAFYGGDARGPVTGYFKGVNDESDLRNQHRVMQNDVPHSTYIPDSSSDLYNARPVFGSDERRQTHPLLFHQESYRTNALPPIESEAGFQQPTRTQLRQMW